MKTSTRIDAIGITSGTLNSRGGLALLVRYISGIGFLPEEERQRNGVVEMFTQVICFFPDGTVPPPDLVRGTEGG